jgi:hypothetical protein
MDGADPRCRVDEADRHVEPHQRDSVATHLVAFGPQTDRHRQVQVATETPCLSWFSRNPPANPATNPSFKAPP